MDTQLGRFTARSIWRKYDGFPFFETLAHSSVDRVSQSILDLVHFLITGRPSDAVSDFIGSGEQMSERVNPSRSSNDIVK